MAISKRDALLLGELLGDTNATPLEYATKLAKAVVEIKMRLVAQGYVLEATPAVAPSSKLVALLSAVAQGDDLLGGLVEESTVAELEELVASLIELRRFP